MIRLAVFPNEKTRNEAAAATGGVRFSRRTLILPPGADRPKNCVAVCYMVGDEAQEFVASAIRLEFLKRVKISRRSAALHEHILQFHKETIAKAEAFGAKVPGISPHEEEGSPG
jgi:hypothetical protein